MGNRFSQLTASDWEFEMIQRRLEETVTRELPTCGRPEVGYKHFFYDDQHAMQTSHIVDNITENNERYDVTLQVGDTVTHAHKSMLSLSSPYFNAMFNNGMANKHETKVELHCVDPEAWKLLYEFAYSSKIIINETDIYKLITTSAFLHFCSVQDECCKLLIQKLHPANCLGNWTFAEEHFCDELRTHSRDYALKNFDEVAKCDEFLSLSFSEVDNLLRDDNLCVLLEENVVKAIIRWIVHDRDERSQYNAHLIKHVRMARMSLKFIYDLFFEPLVVGNDSCRELLYYSTLYHLLPEWRCAVPKNVTTRRTGGVTQHIFAIGGRGEDGYRNSGECYDPANDRWLSIAPMVHRRCKAGYACLGELIYAVGGHDKTSFLSSVETYDPISNKWSLVTDMNLNYGYEKMDRIFPAISAVNEQLYVCGGTGELTRLKRVDRYDPLADRWSTCPSMNSARSKFCTTVSNNCIYAVGGNKLSVDFACTVERYDPRMSKWMYVTRRGVPMQNSCVAALDDMIYCVGGEAFCAQRFNVRRNAWEPISDIKCHRHSPSMVAVDGGLLLLGGSSERQEYEAGYLNSTERYDPRNDEWTVAKPMWLSRSGFGAMVLPCYSMGIRLTTPFF